MNTIILIVINILTLQQKVQAFLLRGRIEVGKNFRNATKLSIFPFPSSTKQTKSKLGWQCAPNLLRIRLLTYHIVYHVQEM